MFGNGGASKRKRKRLEGDAVNNLTPTLFLFFCINHEHIKSTTALKATSLGKQILMSS